MEKDPSSLTKRKRRKNNKIKVFHQDYEPAYKSPLVKEMFRDLEVQINATQGLVCSVCSIFDFNLFYNTSSNLKAETFHYLKKS